MLSTVVDPFLISIFPLIFFTAVVTYLPSNLVRLRIDDIGGVMGLLESPISVLPDC